MSARLSRGKENDGYAAGLSIVRPSDKIITLIWLITFAVCLAVFLYPVYQETWVFALPFAVAGVFYLIFSRNITAVVCIAVILVAIWFITWSDYGYVLVFIAGYLCFGTIGVASIVDAIQRAVYYHVLSHIRYFNVKEKPTFKDKIVAFVFSIPRDIDTRNISADLNVRSRSFPWREMFTTVGLSMVAGMFFWIYMSFNPSFVNLSDTGTYSVTASSLLVFTVMLYIPLLVMPFSIFASTNVRITTAFRDFRIYNGAVSTIQRMAVPIAAALMFVLLAVAFSNDIVAVLVFIGVSALMLFIVVMISTAVYFYSMEAETVMSIAHKWKLFMPVPLLMGLEERDSRGDDLPGTPVRDESDYSGIEVRARHRRAQ